MSSLEGGFFLPGLLERCSSLLSHCLQTGVAYNFQGRAAAKLLDIHRDERQEQRHETPQDLLTFKKK